MTKLAWGTAGERLYETGVDRGVLYPNSGAGVAWNGLIAINETASGGEAKSYYLDGYKYQNRATPEEFQATIEAFTYPNEFEQCNGITSLGYGLFLTQQRRTSFGLCYRTKVGNDVEGDTHGYKLHLIYNALASPTDRKYASISDTPEAMAFSWSITTKPMTMQGHRATPHLIVDTTQITPTLLASIESILYGSADTIPRLPLPSEIITLFTGWPTLQVIDNGDGTFTVYGPDDVVKLINSNTFQITSDTVVNNGNGSFNVTSY